MFEQHIDISVVIAERKIQEAMQNGAFDHLPGVGKPLVMEDLSHLPPEARMAYIILKNSDFIETPKDMERYLSLDNGLGCSSPDEGTKNKKLRKLDLLRQKVRHARDLMDFLPPIHDSQYIDKILTRL